VTYEQIAEWAGLSLHTVRTYASRGQLDTSSVEAVLQWVNVRRAAKGEPMIGQPEDTQYLGQTPPKPGTLRHVFGNVETDPK
jgi:hypothetical protein